MTLLELNYPLDDFVLAVKKRDPPCVARRAMRWIPSRRADRARQRRQSADRGRKRSGLPFIGFITPSDYKRLTAEAFAILAALRMDGRLPRLRCRCDGQQ